MPPGLDPRLIDDCERAEHAAWADLYAALPPAVRDGFGLRSVVSASLLTLAAPGLPVPLFNRVLVRDPSVAVDELAAALAAVAAPGVRAYLQIPPGSRFGELRALVERELGPTTGAWAKFWRSDSVPAGVTTELAVRELERADAEAFGQAVVGNFGLPGELAPWLENLVGRPGWRLFGAFDGKTLAGCGAVYLTPGDAPLGWVGLGAVASVYRRRGAQRSLLAARMRAAFAAGARAVVSETGQPKPGEDGPSFRNLSRLIGIAYTRDNYLARPLLPAT